MCISEGKRRKCFHRDNNQCLKCGGTDELTCDHVIPKALGGKDWLKNLQTLCFKCNLGKGAKIIQYSKHGGTRHMINRFNQEGAYWLT